MYAIILSTLVMCMRNKIYIEGFGKQKAIVTRIDGTWRFYTVEFTYKEKTYYSVVTNDGKTLMPFTTDPIIEVFKTENNKEWCFTKKIEDIGYQSYHYSICDNSYILKANICGTNYSSCRIVNTVKDDYIIDILTRLFQSPYAEDDMIISNKPAKIIKFPGGKNET